MPALDDDQIRQHSAWVRSITNVPGMHRSEMVMLKNGPNVYKTASLLYCGQDADDISKTELRFQTSKANRQTFDISFEKTGTWACENDEVELLRGFLNERFGDAGDYRLVQAGLSAGQLLDFIDRGDIQPGVIAAMAHALATKIEFVSDLSEVEGAHLVAKAVDLRRQQLISAQFAEAVFDPASLERDLQVILRDNLWLLGGNYVSKADRQSFTVLDQYDLVLLRSDNVAHIVELKRANIPKLVKKYRNHFVVGDEVNEAVGQAINYLRHIDENRHMILTTFGVECRRAQASVIIGHPGHNTQDDATPAQIREAIRTYNSHLSRVEVLTYEDLLLSASNSVGALAASVRDDSYYVEVGPDDDGPPDHHFRDSSEPVCDPEDPW